MNAIDQINRINRAAARLHTMAQRVNAGWQLNASDSADAYLSRRNVTLEIDLRDGATVYRARKSRVVCEWTTDATRAIEDAEAMIAAR